MMRSGIVEEGDDEGRGERQRQADRAVLRSDARRRRRPPAMRRLISGSSTVPAAMPMTPRGS